MYKTLLLIMMMITMTVSSQQVTEVLNRMDINQYNATLRIWQKTTNGAQDSYNVYMDMEGQTLQIVRASDNKNLHLMEFMTFRLINGSFVIRGFMVNEEGIKFPCVGFVRQHELEINLGDFIYLFYNKFTPDKA